MNFNSVAVTAYEWGGVLDCMNSEIDCCNYGQSKQDILKHAGDLFEDLILIRRCEPSSYLQDNLVVSVPIQSDFIDSLVFAIGEDSVSYIMVCGWGLNVLFYANILYDESGEFMFSIFTYHRDREQMLSDKLLTRAMQNCEKIAKRRIKQNLATSSSAPAPVPCIQFRNSHIGHFIWNDLNGCAYLNKMYENWQYIELVDLSRLRFLEKYMLTKKAVLKISQVDSLSRKRIIRLLKRNPELHIFSSVNRKVVLSSHAITPNRKKVIVDGEIVLLLNLRTGNRVLLNQFEAYSSLIDFFVESSYKLKVIVTGNNEGGKVQGSTLSSDSIMHEESQLAKMIIIRHENIDIQSLVGVTVRRELSVLSSLCSTPFLVAPWGAGLSKYSWIHRFPCLIHTNVATNQNKNGDKMIYFDPRYVEEPSMHRFLSGVDCGGSSSDPSRFDYAIHPEVMVKEVSEMISSLPA